MKLASFLIISLACLCLPTRAEPLSGIDLKLISTAATIEKSRPFTVGLHIHHHEGYHTYWQNPGIVGVPTSIKWSLPPGFKAGPIQWPYPEMVDMAGHPAHGFHRDVLLMVEIRPPAEIPAKEITLNARINWMACAKTCHPGNATLNLSLPVGTQTPAPARIQRLFDTARKDLPPPLAGWEIRALTPADSPTIRLLLTPKAGTTAKLDNLYFFSSDGQVSSDRPQALENQGPGKYLLSLERSEYGPTKILTLPGVLSGSTDSGKICGTIQTTFPE